LRCGQSDTKHVPRDPRHLYRRKESISTTSGYSIATSVIPASTPTSSPKPLLLAGKITDTLLQIAGFHGSFKCKSCDASSNFNLLGVQVDIGTAKEDWKLTFDMDFELAMHGEFEVGTTTEPYHFKVPIFTTPPAGFLVSYLNVWKRIGH
jgi:hypothetical protein